MNVKSDSEQWLEKYLYDRWQRVRRHSEFIAFCDERKDAFDEDGFLINEFGENGFDLKIDEIGKKFDLEQIYHYSKDIPENKMLGLSPFKESLPVKHLWPDSNVNEAGRIIISPLFDNHYIHLNIDVNANTEQIMGLVKEFVCHARDNIEDFVNERSDLEQRRDAYKAWDLKLEYPQLTLTQITEKYYLDEIREDGNKHVTDNLDKRIERVADNLDKRIERVADKLRRRIERAFELIYGESYDKKKLETQLVSSQEKNIQGKCKTCPNRETQACLTCPVYLDFSKTSDRYSDDTKYQSEIIDEQNKLDYLSAGPNMGINREENRLIDILDNGDE